MKETKKYRGKIKALTYLTGITEREIRENKGRGNI